MIDVVHVEFSPNGKEYTYFYDKRNLELKKGDWVIVKTINGTLNVKVTWVGSTSLKDLGFSRKKLKEIKVKVKHDLSRYYYLSGEDTETKEKLIFLCEKQLKDVIGLGDLLHYEKDGKERDAIVTSYSLYSDGSSLFDNPIRPSGTESAARELNCIVNVRTDDGRCISEIVPADEYRNGDYLLIQKPSETIKAKICSHEIKYTRMKTTSRAMIICRGNKKNDLIYAGNDLYRVRTEEKTLTLFNDGDSIDPYAFSGCNIENLKILSPMKLDELSFADSRIKNLTLISSFNLDAILNAPLLQNLILSPLLYFHHKKEIEKNKKNLNIILDRSLLIEEGPLFLSQDRKTLLLVKEDLEEVRIPFSVMKIEDIAFSQCTKLRRIIFTSPFFPFSLHDFYSIADNAEVVLQGYERHICSILSVAKLLKLRDKEINIDTDYYNTKDFTAYLLREKKLAVMLEARSNLFGLTDYFYSGVFLDFFKTLEEQNLLEQGVQNLYHDALKERFTLPQIEEDCMDYSQANSLKAFIQKLEISEEKNIEGILLSMLKKKRCDTSTMLNYAKEKGFKTLQLNILLKSRVRHAKTKTLLYEALAARHPILFNDNRIPKIIQTEKKLLSLNKEDEASYSEILMYIKNNRVLTEIKGDTIYLYSSEYEAYAHSGNDCDNSKLINHLELLSLIKKNKKNLLIFPFYLSIAMSYEELRIKLFLQGITL